MFITKKKDHYQIYKPPRIAQEAKNRPVPKPPHPPFEPNPDSETDRRQDRMLNLKPQKRGTIKTRKSLFDYNQFLIT